MLRNAQDAGRQKATAAASLQSGMGHAAV